jgi:hypothetical protein
MDKKCNNCNKSIIIEKAGNNDILSKLLIKWSSLEILIFLKIIYQIITRDKINEFEFCDDFNFTDNDKIYSFTEYLNFIIQKTENEDLNNYYLILKSLIIISIIVDSRVKLFIFGNHDKLQKISESFNEKIDIGLYIFKCKDIINHYKNNYIPLEDIGFYATKEWESIGFYCI